MLLESGHKNLNLCQKFPCREICADFVLCTVILITIILVFIGILGGFIIDLFTKTKEKNLPIEHFEIHNHDQHIETEKPTNILDNLQKASPHRAMLLFGILLILTLSILGEIGHSHDIMPLEIEHNHEHHIDWFSIYVASSEQSAKATPERRYSVAGWLRISFVYPRA